MTLFGEVNPQNTLLGNIHLPMQPISPLTEELKQALLTIAEKVVYIDEHGQTYYDALYNALYPPATLLSISAVFNQGQNVVYDTDTLDDLKQYLTVTGSYDDGTTRTVTDYTLSGTLTAGTSTITVSWGGKTTTFSVTVTHTTVQYTVTNNLTNCTTSNNATRVNEDTAYTATLTANTGMEISTATVTMGGTDITATAYNNGTISIASVTGDIVVTATATKAIVLPTDGLLAYFDFRNASFASGVEFPATRGVSGAYFKGSLDGSQQTDAHGIMLDNGTYGGGAAGGLTIDPTHATFAILNYVTNAAGVVLPSIIGGVAGAGSGYINYYLKYSNTGGTSANVKTLSMQTLPNVGTYVCTVYRTTDSQADIFVDGVNKLSATSAEATNFSAWSVVETIRATKNRGNGQITALVYYDRAMTDAEIVDLGEYFATLEVTE